MVEYFPGSGFFPPTLNSFTGNIDEDDTPVLAEIKNFDLTFSDRVELNALSMFHKMNSTTATGGEYIITITAKDIVIVNYTISATGTGLGVHLETQIQNQSMVFEKGEKIRVTIDGLTSAVSGGHGRHKVQVLAIGRYIL